MQRMPDTWLFPPWLLPPEQQARCRVKSGVDSAVPLVEVATRATKERVYALRDDPAEVAVQASIVKRHGSRNRSAESFSKPRPVESPAQATLDF